MDMAEWDFLPAESLARSLGLICNGWEMFPAYNLGIQDSYPCKKLKLSRNSEAVSEEAPADESCPELPDEVLEKIVAMLPYPHILNARKLTRDWKSKLSAPTTNDGNAGFREIVKSVSTNWPTYFPLIFDKSKRALAGLDRGIGKWVRIFQEEPDIEARMIQNQPPWELARRVTGLGSLICVKTEIAEIFVHNVFTGAWKWLPRRPVEDSSYVSWIYMIPDGADHYKVLHMMQLLNENRRGVSDVCTQLYESRNNNNSWAVKLSKVRTCPFSGSAGVYLDGVVYCTQYDNDRGLLEFWAHDVEKGTWSQIPHPLALMLHTFRTIKLLVCQDQLILLVCLKRSIYYTDGVKSPRIRRNAVILFQVDTATGDFYEVYRGPHEPIPDASAGLYVSHGDSIFFGQIRKRTKYIMEFNLRNRTWTHFPSSSIEDRAANLVYSSFAFQPGNNPFIAV